MSIFTSFDPTPLSNSLQGSVSELITQPQLININKSPVLEVYQEGSGSSKKKKASPKTLSKTLPKTLSKTLPKTLPKTLSKTLPKKKLIDTYNKESLVKIAKKHDVSLHQWKFKTPFF